MVKRNGANIADDVSRAFNAYLASGGVLAFPEWHRAAEKDGTVPSHPRCNYCRTGACAV